MEFLTLAEALQCDSCNGCTNYCEIVLTLVVIAFVLLAVFFIVSFALIIILDKSDDNKKNSQTVSESPRVQIRWGDDVGFEASFNDGDYSAVIKKKNTRVEKSETHKGMGED